MASEDTADFYALAASDLEKLKRAAKRLHTEERLTGDQMRDLGHLLEAIARASESIPIP